MKILIVSANPWSFCMAVERAFAQRFSASSPDFLNLFDLCAQWSPHWRRSDRAIERLDRKIPRFVKSVITGKDITPKIVVDWDAVPAPPESIDDLSAFRVDGARIGIATLSSIVSLTTVHPARDYADFGDEFEMAWVTANISAQIGQQVAALGYDEVYLFNGRHCFSRPFCDLLIAAGTRVLRYEQGAKGNSYILSDKGVHRTDARAAMVRSTPFDAAAGEAFFESRLAKSTDDPAAWSASFFTADQAAGRLPEGLDDARILSFFTTSADEFLFVSDKPSFGEFAGQMEAAVGVAEEARRCGATLVLRMHPHLQYKHESWRREWDFDRLRDLGVTIVPPGDEVDTYALVKRSQCVFTFGSMVGFEAAYLGIPCASFGDTLGNELGATVAISTADDIARMVEEPVIPDGARDAALRYASFVATAGAPLLNIDYGTHPDFARVDERIVDPIRYVARKIRTVFDRNPMVPSNEGKLVMDPGLQRRIIALDKAR